MVPSPGDSLKSETKIEFNRKTSGYHRHPAAATSGYGNLLPALVFSKK